MIKYRIVRVKEPTSPEPYFIIEKTERLTRWQKFCAGFVMAAIRCSWRRCVNRKFKTIMAAEEFIENMDKPVEREVVVTINPEEAA